MRSPNWPCQLISGSSNRPATFANGCIISRFPTRPDEFARPSGMRRDSPRAAAAAACRSRWPATTTTFAGSKCSPPSRSIQVAPVARPLASVSIRRTRAPVTSRAPRAIAFGQWVRSVEALAPSLQPDWQVLRWTHGRRPSYGVELIELNSGHQCQPSFVCAAGDLQPGRPDRERRHRGVLGVGRIGRIARQARHAEVAVGPVEVRQQLEVVDRPVVGDAVERADPEVGREGPRPGAGEDDRRAADGVVHERRDRRVVLDDRVVRARGRGCSGWSPSPCAPSAPSRACCPGSRRGRASRPARGRRRLNPAWASRRATTPPDAPAPTIRTSAGSLAMADSSNDADRAGESARRQDRA